MDLALTSLGVVLVLLYRTWGLSSIILVLVPLALGFFTMKYALKTAAEKDELNILHDFSGRINANLMMEEILNCASSRRILIRWSGTPWRSSDNS